MNSLTTLLRRMRNRLSDSASGRGRRRRQVGRGPSWAELLEPRQLLTVDLLSTAVSGAAGAAVSNNPQLSRNGRFVAYQSDAANLAITGAADGNTNLDVFVRDLLLGTTTLISVTPGGRGGDGDSWSPSISDDGRFVAFSSMAEDLVATPTTYLGGVNSFVRDRDTDKDGIFDEPGSSVTYLVSRSGEDDDTSGNSASGGSVSGAEYGLRTVISGDGSTIVFGSLSTNLLDPGSGVVDPFFFADLYFSRPGGRVGLISVNADGTSAGVSGGGQSAVLPSVSFNGARVAFQSTDFDLVDDDIEGVQDVFVRDLPTATTMRVSIDAGARGGDGISFEPIISRNGKHVVFGSLATNLVPGDTNGLADVFVHDLRTRTTSLISRNRSGSGAESGSLSSPPSPGTNESAYSISDNGRYVVFSSLATNLLDPAEGISDTNGTADVFWFDRDADNDGIFDEPGPTATATRLVSINADGTAAAASPVATGGASAVSISGDGRYVLFTCPGTDVVESGATGTSYYLRDMFTELTTLIALTGSPGALFAGVSESAIGTDPLRVAFASAAPGLDAGALDTNATFDVFSWIAPPDISAGLVAADGGTTLSLSYRIENQAATGPFTIGVYRSTDDVFDGADELLDTITVDGAGLAVGKYAMTLPIGSGPGEVSLPGAGATETDEDYQLLFVFNHVGEVAEIDSVTSTSNNVTRLQGLYHPPGGAVFAHGRASFRSLPASALNDELLVTDASGSITVALNKSIVTYPAATVTGVRFRGHDGDDVAQAGSTPDALFGGSGGDKLRGGSGDDLIGGGADADALFGEAGFDTFFDGMGDDAVDFGPDGGVVISTPGSDDVFTAGGSSSSIDFSRDDHAITLDLDSPAVQTVDAAGNTVRLIGQWNRFTGSPFGDMVYVRPLPTGRTINGGPGIDRVIIDAQGAAASMSGNTVTIAGFGPIALQSVESIRLVNAARRIIDDGDATGFTHTGFFDSNPNFPQGFNGGVKFSAANSGNTATWRFTGLVPGTYQVAATWTHAGDRAKDAPYTIRNGTPSGTILHQVNINQEVAPNDFHADGVNWEILSAVTITVPEMTVQLKDIADQFVTADAIRIIPVSDMLQLSGSLKYFDPVLNEFVDVAPGGIVDFGSIARSNSGTATTIGRFRIENTGPGDLVPGSVDVSGTGFSLLQPPTVLLLRPDHATDFEVTFSRSSAGPFNGVISIPTNQSGLPVLSFNVTVNVVDDNTPPQVSIVSPPDERLDFEGTSIPVAVNVMDDLSVARVEFNINGTIITDTTAPFEVDYALTPGLLPPSALNIQVMAFDVAGNAASDDKLVTIVPDSPPVVSLVAPPAGSPFFAGTTLPVIVEADDDLMVQRIELRSVNGSLLSSSAGFPSLPIPQQAARGPVSVMAVTVDVFGRETESNVVTFAPTAPLTFTSPDPQPASRVPADVLTPLLRWNPLPGATAYELFLRNLRTQHAIVPPRVFGTELRLTDPLQQGIHRIWVRAIDGSGNRLPWSEPHDVLIDIPAPSSMKPVFHITSAGTDGRLEMHLMSDADPTELAEPSPFETLEVFVRDTTNPKQPDVVERELPLPVARPVTHFAADEFDVWVRRVNTAGERGPWSDPVRHTITTPTPLAPTINGPSGTVINGPLIVDWNAVRYADHYSVFIRRTDRTAPDVVVHDVRGLDWSPDGPLVNGSYLVWVRAWTGAGVFGPWSSSQAFTLNVPVPGIVTLVGPSGTTSSTTPLFQWQAVPHAASYWLWISRLDVPQHPVLLEKDILATSFRPMALLPGQYRFWVRALNGLNIAGPWSSPFDIEVRP